MVYKCIAAGCSNTSSASIVLYSFPKDATLKREWENQVSRTRANRKAATKYSCLCSKHFTDDCFEGNHTMACIHLWNRVIRIFSLVDKDRMPQFCYVPGCSNCLDREKHLSYHRLPLKRKAILKKWIHRIGRKNLLLNEKMCVYSEHFLDSKRRHLRKDEVPLLKLPLLSTRVTEPTPRRAVVQHVEENDHCADTESETSELQTSPGLVDSSSVVEYRDIGISTDLTMHDIETREKKENELTCVPVIWKTLR